MSTQAKTWKRVRNAVCQVFVTTGEYNLLEPYLIPKTKETRGSGFFISKEGHILTNAHVIRGMIEAYIRVQYNPNVNIRVELVAVSFAKDVAMLRCDPSDMKKLGEISVLTFEDDHNVTQMQEVMTAGYPLGMETIQFTAGKTTGYATGDYDNESRTPQSFIQIDASLNPGNSGGPLINSNQKVIGINSAGIPSHVAQGMNYAIPTRVVLSILDHLYQRERTPQLRKVIEPASLGLTFQRITDSHFILAGCTKESEMYGIRIKDVLPSSRFQNLKEGDILQSIKYDDRYYKKEAQIVISKHETVKLFIEGAESTYTQGRKVSLMEVLDSIPYGAKLHLQVLRPTKKTRLYTSGIFDENRRQAISRIHMPIDDQNWLLFGGAIWIDLNANIVDALGTSKYLSEFHPFEKRNKPRVIVTKMFPLTDISGTESIHTTEVVKTFADVKVRSIGEMSKLLVNYSQRFILITFRSGKEIVLDVAKTKKRDNEIRSQYGVPN